MWYEMYSSCEMFFMSGTGNSYRAATWMAETAKNKGATLKLHQILKDTDDIKEETDLVGMVFPTHGFTAPWQVIRFALNLPRGEGKHAFVVATRAGTRVASVPLPGMEGTAGYLIALLLMIKGYVVQGVMGLDMPSNWMSLHWGLSLANSRFIIGRAKVKTDSFMKAILAGDRKYKGILSLLLGLILSPISLGYLLIGRFFFAKLFFASDSCTGCGLCAKSCPMGAIRMTGGNKPRPYWTFSCESCMRCMGYCPSKAVEASHSFAIVLYFIATLPVSLYLLKSVSKIMPIEHGLFFYKIAFDYIYALISFFAAYLLLSWLIRIPVLNKIVTYTTFTHLYRRYHEPGTALKDMVPEDPGNDKR